jgi:hypothetical protein
MFTFAHNRRKPLCAPKMTPPARKYVKNVQYRTYSCPESLHYVVVKTRELTAQQISSVPCTTCGAAAGEVCELHSGDPRTEPHRDRKLSAAEAIEKKSVKPQQTLRLVAAAPTS